MKKLELSDFKVVQWNSLYRPAMSGDLWNRAVLSTGWPTLHVTNNEADALYYYLDAPEFTSSHYWYYGNHSATVQEGIDKINCLAARLGLLE